MLEPSDYEIKIDYVPGRDDLANSLLALSKIVEGHRNIADILLKASGEDETVSTSVEMQNIEKGSIKLVFKKIFKQKNGKIIQDEALNNFINNATGTLTSFVNSNDEVKKENINIIRNELLSDYNRAGGLNPLSVDSIKDEQILNCLKALVLPKGLLGRAQTVKVKFLGQSYDMNPKFFVDEEKIDREYFERDAFYNQKISIQIKKPDYLGASKWSVVYNEKSVEAKISDDAWLKKFQNSELSLVDFPSPKDTVTVDADIFINKKDGKEQSVELDIKRVLQVHKYVRRNLNLFD